MHIAKILFLSIYFLFISTKSISQNCDPVKMTLDKNLTQKEKDLDSIIFGHTTKLSLYYQQDSLSKYCYAAMSFSRYLQKNKIAFESISSSSLLKLWREPKTQKEFIVYRQYMANIGYYYDTQIGNYSKAKFAYEKALSIYRHINDTSLYWYIHYPLANIYTRFGDYEKSLTLFKECESILIKKGENKNLIRMYVDMAKVYKEINKPEEAKQICLKVINSPDSSSKSLVNSLLFLSNLYFTEDNHSEAIVTLNKLDKPLSDLYEEQYAQNKLEYYYERAAGFYQLKSQLIYPVNKEESSKYFNTSIDYLRKAFNNESRREFGKYYNAYNELLLSTGEYNSSFKYANKAISAVISNYDTTKVVPSRGQLFPENTIMEALTLKGKAYELKYLHTKDISDLVDANQCYNTAIKVSELLRNEYIFNESEFISLKDNKALIDASLNNYYQLYTLEKKEHYLDKIQLLLIDAKANVLHKKQNFTYAVKMMSNENKSLYQNLNHTIDSFKTNKISNSSYLEMLDSMKVFQEQQLAKYNRPTTILNNYIDYFIGSKNTFAFVNNDINVDFIKLGNSDSIRFAIKIYRKLIKQNNPTITRKEFENISASLYKMLIKPLGVLDENLIIIPDEELALVSFDGLIDGKNLPLINKHSISYYFQALGSKNILNSKQAITASVFCPEYVKSPKQNLALLRDKLFEIKGAQDESQKINEILNADIFSSTEASKENFLNEIKTKSIIHFAGHAVLDKLKNSYLAFNSYREDSSHIYTEELDNLNLELKLLSLSACNTASGKIQPGEGTFSLSRSFSAIGAESILSTLWEVSDQTSAEIMISFYSYLKKGQSKGEALRNAKLKYLENADPDYQHPYYWSGIIIMGDRSPLFVNPIKKYYWLIGGVIFITGILYLTKKGKETSIAA